MSQNTALIIPNGRQHVWTYHGLWSVFHNQPHSTGSHDWLLYPELLMTCYSLNAPTRTNTAGTTPVPPSSTSLLPGKVL
jgi:hypothetical protein